MMLVALAFDALRNRPKVSIVGHFKPSLPTRFVEACEGHWQDELRFLRRDQVADTAYNAQYHVGIFLGVAIRLALFEFMRDRASSVRPLAQLLSARPLLETRVITFQCAVRLKGKRHPVEHQQYRYTHN